MGKKKGISLKKKEFPFLYQECSIFLKKIPLQQLKNRNIAIVDDHRLLRETIADLVRPNFNIVIQAENGNDFIKQFNKGAKPNIVLLDINMPEMDGLETAKWIRDNTKDIKIIMLTMYNSEETIIKSIKIGANGYMLKNISTDELLKGLETVFEKDYYFDANIMDKVVEFIKKVEFPEKTSLQLKDILEELPLRDREIVKLLSSGLTDSEIATSLSISRKSVEYFRYKLMTKLKVNSRAELVNLILKN